MDSLLDIRKQVQSKTDQLEGEVKKAEKDYAKRLGELDKGFEVSSPIFHASPLAHAAELSQAGTT